MSKETLGYPTRTDAVLALAADGLDSRQIGAKIGIAPSTVAALISSAQRAKSRRSEACTTPKRGRYGMPTAQLETAVMDLYEDGLSRDQIAERLIDAAGHRAARARPEDERPDRVAARKDRLCLVCVGPSYSKPTTITRLIAPRTPAQKIVDRDFDLRRVGALPQLEMAA